MARGAAADAAAAAANDGATDECIAATAAAMWLAGCIRADARRSTDIVQAAEREATR